MHGETQSARSKLSLPPARKLDAYYLTTRPVRISREVIRSVDEAPEVAEKNSQRLATLRRFAMLQEYVEAFNGKTNLAISSDDLPEPKTPIAPYTRELYWLDRTIGLLRPVKKGNEYTFRRSTPWHEQVSITRGALERISRRDGSPLLLCVFNCNVEYGHEGRNGLLISLEYRPQYDGILRAALDEFPTD